MSIRGIFGNIRGTQYTGHSPKYIQYIVLFMCFLWFESYCLYQTQKDALFGVLFLLNDGAFGELKRAGLSFRLTDNGKFCYNTGEHRAIIRNKAGSI